MCNFSGAVYLIYCVKNINIRCWNHKSCFQIKNFHVPVHTCIIWYDKRAIHAMSHFHWFFAQVCPYYKLISRLKIVTTVFQVNRYRMLEVRRAMRRQRIFRDRTSPLERYNDLDLIDRFWFDRRTILQITQLLQDDLESSPSATNKRNTKPNNLPKGKSNLISI